jgi:hypothetical protein
MELTILIKQLQHYHKAVKSRILTRIKNRTDDRQDIIDALDRGEDVNGWEDGAGNTIYV